MRSLEDDLRQLDDAFPGVRPTGGAMTDVVARGRRRQVRHRVLSGVAGAALVLTALTVVPQVLEQPDRTPSVLSHVGVGDDGGLEDPVIAPDPVPDEESAQEPPPALEEAADEGEGHDDGHDEAKGDGEATEPKTEEPPVVEADTTPPPIAVTDPVDGSHTTSKSYTFRGETEPGARVFAGQWEADVTAQGRWALTLVLSPGKNTVTFTAKDAALNRATDTVTVHYDAPAGAGKPAAQGVGFTATQEHASKEWDPPYTYYSGTAKPGTKVKAISDHGNGHGYADDHGNWRFKVWFEGAPAGSHTWAVEVTSLHTGESKRFEFTGHRPGAEPAAKGFTATQEKTHVQHDPPYNYYSGTAEPGSGVLVSSEYGTEDGRADDNGHYRIKVWFHGAPAGTHSWPVTVKSIATGETRTFEMTGTRPEAAPSVAYTANQQYGTCDEPTPYDVFWGTAQPESKVRVDSAYGSGYVYADADGHWELRVDFPSAPRGETFEVAVKSVHTGEVRTFAFTATQPA